MAFISWTKQKYNAEEIDVMLEKNIQLKVKIELKEQKWPTNNVRFLKFTISLYKLVRDTVVQHFTDQFESIHTGRQKPQVWICKASVSDILIPLILF